MDIPGDYTVAVRMNDREQDYRSYYSDETAEMVAKRFERDIELFGYEFDSRP